MITFYKKHHLFGYCQIISFYAVIVEKSFNNKNTFQNMLNILEELACLSYKKPKLIDNSSTVSHDRTKNYV